MSYILEALRKSERERNLGKVPTLSATTEVAASRSRLHWWVVLATIVIAAAIGWAWTGGGIFSPRRLDAVTTPQVSESGRPSTSADDTHSGTASMGSSAGSTAPAPADITLNVISWSQDPARRFAMINQKIYREGDSPSPGVTIKAIESDKVVVTAHGRELVLHP